MEKKVSAEKAVRDIRRKVRVAETVLENRLLERLVTGSDLPEREA